MAVLLIKLFVLMINLVILHKGKNAVYRFIEAILKKRDYCKKIIKKHFNKNLVMPAEDEERFQSRNIC